MTGTNIDIMIILWCSFALFLGGTIKGTFGIGTPLLTVPLMSLVLPAQLTVVLMAAPVVLANGWQAFNAGNPVGIARRFWPLCIAMVFGTYIGTRMLSSIETRPLVIAIAALIAGFVLIQSVRPRYRCPPRFERQAGVCAGFIAGIVGGISSMFGPLLVLYLLALDLRKNEFVQAVSMLFLWAVIPWVIALVAFGMLDPHTALLSLAASVPTLLGIALGQLLRKRIDDTRFRGAVLFLVALSASVMLAQATLL